MRRIVATLVVALLVSPALAAVVPNDRENTAGNATFLGPLASAARTYQLLIDDTQLTGLAGQQLSGITWRLNSAATVNFPAADANFASFDVRLSDSVDPVNRSLTFANNVVGAQTLVRSGPLTIPAGSFPATTAPHPFGMVINFDTPYNYTGGNLLIELRHTGLVGGSSSVDAISTSTAPYGTGVSAAWTSSYTGVTGAQGNAVITMISVVPEPGAVSLALGGALLALRRRR
jgi:hypothetical protein